MRIAIDGPAGSGKSTVAKAISKLLSIPYLDTGSVYRAFAYIAREKKKDIKNLEEVLSLFDNAPVVKLDIAKTDIYYEGAKLDVELKGEEIGRYASLIGSVPQFRERMIKFFRDLSDDMQIVAEGRDTGTHIFPNAPVKLFITASLEERARRRFLELLSSGVDADYKKILEALAERDRRDMERPLYPFKPAEDAIIIDTTGMSVEQVIQEVLKIIKEKASHLKV
ncbi:(d)CMP kinase [Hydrogenobacter thermophilus]|uniref:(d)CMP kinase n=1 Tax=Hydrogenobacter thermophilus TaxID=940 RepID=UPI0030FB6E6D